MSFLIEFISSVILSFIRSITVDTLSPLSVYNSALILFPCKDIDTESFPSKENDFIFLYCLKEGASSPIIEIIIAS